jgi:hypothetical protein
MQRSARVSTDATKRKRDSGSPEVDPVVVEEESLPVKKSRVEEHAEAASPPIVGDDVVAMEVKEVEEVGDDGGTKDATKVRGKVEEEEEEEEAPDVTPSPSFSIDYSGTPNEATIRLIRKKNAGRKSEDKSSGPTFRLPETCTRIVAPDLARLAASLNIPHERTYDGVVCWTKDKDELEYAIRWRDMKKEAEGHKQQMKRQQEAGCLPTSTAKARWILDYFAQHGISQKGDVGRALIYRAFNTFKAPSPPKKLTALDETLASLVQSATVLRQYCALLQVLPETVDTFAVLVGEATLAHALCSLSDDSLNWRLAELEEDESVVARLIVRESKIRTDAAGRRVAVPPVERGLKWPPGRPLRQGDGTTSGAIRRIIKGAPSLFALDEQRQIVSIVGLHEEQGLAVARRIADVERELMRRRLPVEAIDNSLFPDLVNFVNGNCDPQVREILSTMTVPKLKSLARSRGIRPLPTKRQMLLDALYTARFSKGEEGYKKRLHAALEGEADKIGAWAGRVEEIRAELAPAHLLHDFSTLLSTKRFVQQYVLEGKWRDSAIEAVHDYIKRVREGAWYTARTEAFGLGPYHRSWTLVLDVDNRVSHYDNSMAKHEMSCYFVDVMLSAATHGSTRQVVAALLDEYGRELEAWRERMSLQQARITSYFEHVVSWLESVVPRAVLLLESVSRGSKIAVPSDFHSSLKSSASWANAATPGTIVKIPPELLAFAKRWSLLRDAYFHETGSDLLENLALLNLGSRTLEYLLDGPRLFCCTPKSDPFSKLPSSVLREICAPLYKFRRLCKVGGALSVALAFPYLRVPSYPLSQDEIIDRIVASVHPSDPYYHYNTSYYLNLWQDDIETDLRESNMADYVTFRIVNQETLQEAAWLLRKDDRISSR